MTVLARVVEERRDDVSIAAIEGEVDASNVAGLGERLRVLVTNHSSALLIDLSATTYLDSAGVNLLFELAAQLEHRQQRLHVVLPEGARIARVLAIVGLDAVAAVHATREAALAQWS